MRRSWILLAVLAFTAMPGCAPEPYLRITGKVKSTVAISRPSFSESGMRLGITGMACHVSVVEHWCPVSAPECRPEPTVTKDEPAECSKQVFPEKFLLHTPWSQVYPGTYAPGGLDVKIDWKAIPIDSIAEAKLRTGWLLSAVGEAGDIEGPLTLVDADIRALLVAVQRATGNDYSTAPAGEHAVLTAVISNEPNNAGENHVLVSVTNHGPSPAYRVVAQLKSNAEAVQGAKISFGRVDPSETKKRARDFLASGDGDEHVDVEVTSSNAAPALAVRGVQLKSKRVTPEPAPAPPQLSCAAPVKQAPAGKRLRVPCEASNPGDKELKGVTYKLAIAKAEPMQVPGPTDLAPHAPPSKFDVDVTLPNGAALGPLDVAVTATAPNVLPVQQDIAVEVIQLHRLCKPGELTIDGYRRKHKLLDDERNAGNLTKEEFNDLLAELWTCVRPR